MFLCIAIVSFVFASRICHALYAPSASQNTLHTRVVNARKAMGVLFLRKTGLMWSFLQEQLHEGVVLLQACRYGSTPIGHFVLHDCKHTSIFVLILSDVRQRGIVQLYDNDACVQSIIYRRRRRSCFIVLSKCTNEREVVVHRLGAINGSGVW